MLSCTHCSASSQSRTPRFDGASSIQPKPSKPSRYEIDTVTTPSRLNERPSYQGLAGEPAKKPPPWIQTSTGRAASVSPGTGVKTFTFSVASPGTDGSGMSVTPGSPRCAVGPNSSASRTPVHGSAGSGAANRSGPTGGFANGMPRNAAEPPAPGSPRQRPRTLPVTVSASA